MTELSTSTRALLDAARGGGPDPAAIARMRGKIETAVAAPAAASATTTIGIAGKLGLLALVLVVATGAVVLGTRSRSIDSVAVAITEPVPAPVAKTVRESSPPVAVAPAEIEIEMPEARARPARAKAVEPITLAREVELVDRAMAAVRRGDARAALAAVHAYTAEAGQRGQLAEDAAAIEIEALCTLRDSSAAARRSVFEARWPASAQRAKLARACSF
jgi:hypothetical protein